MVKKLLFGRQLIWTVYDPENVLPVVVAQAVETHFANASANTVPRYRPIGDLEEIATQSELGLVVWSVGDRASLAPIVHSIAGCRQRPSPPVRVVCCRADLSRTVPILFEAGAQLVVSQVTSLMEGITSILRNDEPFVPLVSRSSHPLASGLVARLPWPELDQAGD